LPRFERRPEESNDPIVLKAFIFNPSSLHAPQLTEYDSYPVVMVFSEGHMRLYEDIGLTLKVDKIISSEDLPPGLETARVGMYCPRKA
jgi:hypothetical protein